MEMLRAHVGGSERAGTLGKRCLDGVREEWIPTPGEEAAGT